ncbi:MAG: HAMP domain-containing histidine kinase [Fibrobacter sp.]|nr:HAMP domain-containing histidine kinase [Fibrobacter sp.]
MNKHQTVIRDRLVFVSIFIVIAIPLTILFLHTYEQSTTLEEKTQDEDVNNAYNDMSTRLVADYVIENTRSYKDYGILKSIPVIGGSSTQFSGFFAFPDSSGPFCNFDGQVCRKGLVGHFQIFHNGDLLTPFYPDTNYSIGRSVWDNFSPDDKKLRKRTRDKIQHLLDTLGIKNKEPKSNLDTAGLRNVIDQFWENIPDSTDEASEEPHFKKIVTRIETTSEEEAQAYIAETAPVEFRQTFDIPEFNGGVDISDLEMKTTNDYIVFYRQIYIGQQPVVQGFVVEKIPYLKYMTHRERSIYNSYSSPYAIDIVLENTTLFTIGSHDHRYKLKLSKPFPAPYENVIFKMYIKETSRATGSTILTAGVILLLVIAICLITIYRFTQSKVALATKRQDFVSAITHELKTPLTAIKMYAEMLQSFGGLNEEKRQKYYTQIASEADRLSRLIQNVLNLSKLDGNRWNVQLRQERPKAVLDDFIATYSRNVEKQGFELTVSSDTDADNVSLLIDRDAIMQILMNLVDNSLKFSKNASYKMINIELAIKGTDMYLAVRDYGPGIPPAEMKKVFQEFYRVENEMTRQTSGTGIGLSMVKKLCTLCNMQIEVENAHPGLRTKIHFQSLSI